MARASKQSASKASPYFVETMAARLVHELPEGDDWSYEIKFDGYRALGSKNVSQVRLMSRNDKSLAGNFPAIVEAMRGLRVESALIDGEVVALDEKGRPSFQLLQNSRSSARAIVYYVFDLLYLDGEDWRDRPLAQRRAKLAEILKPNESLKLSLSFNGPAGRPRCDCEAWIGGRHCEAAYLRVPRRRSHGLVGETKV